MINQFKCYPKYHSGWEKNQLPPNKHIIVFPRKKNFLCVYVCLCMCLFFGPQATEAVLKLQIIIIFWPSFKKKIHLLNRIIIDLIYINILNFKKSVTKFSRVFSRFDCCLHNISVVYIIFLFIKY